MVNVKDFIYAHKKKLLLGIQQESNRSLAKFNTKSPFRSSIQLSNKKNTNSASKKAISPKKNGTMQRINLTDINNVNNPFQEFQELIEGVPFKRSSLKQNIKEETVGFKYKSLVSKPSTAIKSLGTKRICDFSTKQESDYVQKEEDDKIELIGNARLAKIFETTQNRINNCKVLLNI